METEIADLDEIFPTRPAHTTLSHAILRSGAPGFVPTSDPRPGMIPYHTLRLVACIQGSPGLTLEEVRQAIQVYAAAHPPRIFGTVADLAGRATDRGCPASSPAG
jgi:hypothetical protein